MYLTSKIALKTIFCLMFSHTFTIFAASTAFAEISETDRAHINDKIHDRLSVEIRELKSSAISEIMQGQFIATDVEFQVSDDGRNGFSMPPFVLLEGELKELETLSQDRDLPMFTSLIKQDFRLKTDADAEKIELVMEALYPSRRFDKKVQKIVQIDNAWVFVRKKTFGKPSGLVVTTSQDGKVQNTKFEINLANVLDAIKSED